MTVIRFSHLRAFGRSAMHGQHALANEQEQTAAMQRGTAVHAILFGTRKVCGYPGSQRRGKEYEAFAADHADSEILTMAEYEKARRMADAVRKCSVAEPLLHGAFEETLLFRWNGLDCRATPDVRGIDFLTELKTSATADPVQFPWRALRMHYHAQMRMQAIACEVTGTCKPLDHYIVCVEASEPFPVQVFRIDEKALLAGEKLLTLWAERLKNAVASDSYPAYSSCIMPIDLPDEEAQLVFSEEE
jgi:hypothetical protein